MQALFIFGVSLRPPAADSGYLGDTPRPPPKGALPPLDSSSVAGSQQRRLRERMARVGPCDLEKTLSGNDDVGVVELG